MTARITGTKFRVGDEVWFIRQTLDTDVRVPCEVCGGSGALECPDCGGLGMVRLVLWEDHNSTIWSVSVCIVRGLSGSENIKTNTWESYAIDGLSGPDSDSTWPAELLYSTKRAAKAAATRANKELEDAHPQVVEIPLDEIFDK